MGCVIFLGGNGWGPTHLWEAERAVARYREQPRFKLIPAALPGIKADDMKRLGAGKIFQEINWADFTRRLDDPNSLSKLNAALTGQALPQDIRARAPDALPDPPRCGALEAGERSRRQHPLCR